MLLHIFLFSNVSKEINHKSSIASNPCHSYKHKQKLKEDWIQIYSGNSFFFFIGKGKNTGEKREQTQQRIECIFQSGAELCAKSPRGRPLLKAISSQNECSPTIGLALISIHLACLCAEPAGAAAGGLGAKEVSVCISV